MPEWWTFAGHAANAGLAPGLSAACECQVTFDRFSLQFEPWVQPQQIETALNDLRSADVAQMLPDVDAAAIKGMKFAECLPPLVALRILQARSRSQTAISKIMNESVRFVIT